MILEIKKWCEGIIVAVIISIIIEMIVPDGKNKKYIKVIIGVYIMFVSLAPLLKFLKYDFKIDDNFNFATTPTSQNIDSNIKDIYVSGIENALKSEIENLGYKIEKVKIYTDINYENIEKIEIKIKGKIGEITPIEIGENKAEENYSDIINLIESDYSVDSGNIVFK